MVKVFGTLLWPCERLRRSWSRHHRGRRRFHRFGILVLVDGQLPVPAPRAQSVDRSHTPNGRSLVQPILTKVPAREGLTGCVR